ncbi:MAG: HEPN domain-containing protein [Thermoanaerobaculia bacterium]
MTPRDAGVAAWLEKADSDLLCIENNVAASRVPWDAVVFHAQQAGEKVLKALLVAAGAPVPRTHDLVALLSLVRSAGFGSNVCRREDAEDARSSPVGRGDGRSMRMILPKARP